LVVLPSFSEGIPNVLREGMMCGRPFVATRVGGIPEITRPPIGRLVEPGDPDGLADALQGMLDEQPKVDEKVVREVCITWEESARQVADCIRGVLR
jgi:glycosyltransferase involved in cell wall biosynthesis